jgi:hypothetical protein
MWSKSSYLKLVTFFIGQKLLDCITFMLIIVYFKIVLSFCNTIFLKQTLYEDARGYDKTEYISNEKFSSGKFANLSFCCIFLVEEM